MDNCTETGGRTALAGLDMGTTGCKCTVATAAGEILAACYREYAVSRTAGAHQADAAVLWDTAKTVIQSACRESPLPVTALAVTSFGESVVLLDGDGQPLFPVLLYTDPKGQEESAALCETLGERRVFGLCGHRPNAMYSLPKLMALSKEAPERFSRIRHILPVASFLAYRLCGECVTDYSLASRTMMFDVRKLDWCPELLEAGGISRAALPQAVPMGTAAGTVKPELAQALGLHQTAKIVIGCQDQIAAVIGAGALSPGLAVLGSGTVECVTPVFDGIPAALDAMLDSGYAIVPAINGLYVTYAFIFTGGALLQWYRDRFAAKAVREAEKRGESAYAVLDREVRPEPTGLLFLPHFAGAATPYMNQNAKGAMLGLTLEHDEKDFYRAILEGIAYESRVNLERLQSAGIPIKALRATGGGAKSKMWLQIKADILNKPLETLQTAEAGTMGSLMLAGLAAGEFSSLTEAMTAVRVKEQIRPGAHREKYDEFFERYRRVYQAMQEIYNE